MRVALVTTNDSKVDYSQLGTHSNDIILVFKTPAELALEKDYYDFIMAEERAVGASGDISYLKEKTSLERVFLILEESKANLVDTYLLQGVRDVFVLPINFTELAIKLKHSASLKKNTIFANTRAGMSLKQILIFEVLKMQGPQGASRKQIMEEIWEGEKVEPKNVDVHIHNLRKILKKQDKEIIWRQNRWFLNG